MPRILLEDTIGTFAIKRGSDGKPLVTLSESASGKSLRRIPGCLSLSDTLNGNNRKYPRPVWEKNLNDSSTLQQRIRESRAWGTLEHPKDGIVDLNSPIAVMTTKAVLTESGAVEGEITILNNAHGDFLMSLIEAGWNPTVSSRGYGSLVKDQSGCDIVQEDFVCEGWDPVATPSFSQAICVPQRESVEPAPKQPVAESSPNPAQVQENLKGATPSAPNNKNTKMNIQEIKSRIAALKGVDIKTLSPKTFAEGLNEMQNLHTDISTFVAEDAKRSYEGSKLHTELEHLEEGWSTAQKAPSIANAKLTENHAKLAKVTQAVVKTALDFKTKLGESATKLSECQQLINTAVKRGRWWKRHAESLEIKGKRTGSKYNLACEALDIMAARYKADMTAVGRRLIEVELASQLKDNPKLAERLKNAKVPSQVADIREALTAKPKGTAVNEGKKPATQDPAPAPAPAPAATPASSMVRGTMTEAVVNQSRGFSHQNVLESAALSRRLSESNKQ